jgi:Icc-related predicted phosphoesterase
MYSQAEMWMHVFSLLPGLLLNRLRYGRYLDVFVTHAPPWGIHDAQDLPHQGIKAFLWLDRVFQPVYHLHGHTHLHHQTGRQETHLGKTRILNVYGYQQLQLTA